MNKKGYTLIELLAVIVIISLLGGIAVISYSSYQQNTAERVFKTYMDSMHEATIMYFLENTSQVPTSNNPSKTIYLSDLKIEPIKNPYDINDKCLTNTNGNSYVETSYIDKSNNKGISGIKYKVCLICNKYRECKEYIN